MKLHLLSRMPVTESLLVMPTYLIAVVLPRASVGPQPTVASPRKKSVLHTGFQAKVTEVGNTSHKLTSDYLTRKA